MSEEKKNDLEELDSIANKLLRSRTVVISHQVDSKLSAKVLSQLILLEQIRMILFGLEY